jgi:tRNA threonylcarbamoyl adenosine modification protein YjeE
MSVVFDQITSEDQVEDLIIPEVCRQLGAAKPFCLWLRGDLGAGKTTFAGKLLHGLGLSKRIPVLSPTFTYLTEYKIAEGLMPGTIAHLDLYRMAEGDGESVAALFAERIFVGKIVEWPERCPKAEDIAPTAILDISFPKDDNQKRRYVFSNT